MINIYVGNVPFKATQEEVENLFSQHGEVASVRLITDKFTGASRGFAFVQMNDEEGKQAIEKLNGAEFQGKVLRVNEARPREDRPARREGGYNGGGNGGGNRFGGNRRY